MTASLKASSDGTQAIIQVGGVDKVVIGASGISSGVAQSAIPQPLTLGSPQATTSGTSIDFTGIPSWVKRLTVAFRGVSTNGASNLLVQIGSGSVQTSGYQSATGNGSVQHTSTAGMVVETGASTLTVSALMTFINTGSNVWVASFSGGRTNDGLIAAGGGDVALSGALDRVRITTVNGTDTFDAGSVNILYE